MRGTSSEEFLSASSATGDHGERPNGRESTAWQNTTPALQCGLGRRRGHFLMGRQVLGCDADLPVHLAETVKLLTHFSQKRRIALAT